MMLVQRTTCAAASTYNHICWRRTGMAMLLHRVLVASWMCLVPIDAMQLASHPVTKYPALLQGKGGLPLQCRYRYIYHFIHSSLPWCLPLPDTPAAQPH